MKRYFQVVENAGYEGEYTHPKKFAHSWDAYTWGQRKFGDEWETLHFQVIQVLPDGSRTYEY